MSTINGKVCVANGRNLIVQSELKSGFLNISTGGVGGGTVDFHSDNYIPTNGATVFTFGSPDYVFKGSSYHTLEMYDSDKNYLGYQLITSATQTLSKSNVAYIRFSINSADEGNTTGNSSDWLANHRYKLEKGSVATPLTPAPVDKVFSNGKQVYGRNLYLNSKAIEDGYGINQGAKVTVEHFDTATNMWHIVAAQGQGSVVGIYFYGYVTDTLPDNSYWSYSIDIKGTGVVSKIGINESTRNPVIGTVGSEWSRISQTGGVDTPTAKTIVMYFDTTDSPLDVYIKLPKLEIGNTPTPWTPAPEDVM